MVSSQQGTAKAGFTRKCIARIALPCRFRVVFVLPACIALPCRFRAAPGFHCTQMIARQLNEIATLLHAIVDLLANK